VIVVGIEVFFDVVLIEGRYVHLGKWRKELFFWVFRRDLHLLGS
jgi:hypothetical protein